MSPITGYPITPIARFMAKVCVEANECHRWTGSGTRQGYGHVRRDGRLWMAHRWIWTQTRGPIPPGLTIDHLCRNRACVNPAHMELVTQRENLLRGDTFAAKQAAQTVCLRGHPFDAANTYVAPPTKRKPRGQRMCRTCNRERQRA